MSEKSVNETVFDDESMHVGQVYAKALLAAVGSSGNVDEVITEFESLVHDVLDKQPNLETALADPKVGADEKIRLLDRVFGKSMNPTLLTFLKVVARRRRLNAIRSIYQAASRLRDEAIGRMRITVTTAQALDASAVEALKSRLQDVFKKDVVLSAKVDASVLGGLVVRVGDVVFDGSVDGQLKQLKKATLAKAETAIREKLTSLAS